MIINQTLKSSLLIASSFCLLSLPLTACNGLSLGQIGQVGQSDSGIYGLPLKLIHEGECQMPSYTRYEVKGDGMTMDGKEKFTDYREFKGKYDAHGLSVFAPLSDKLVKSPKMAEYQGLDFTKETGWGDFITDLNARLIEAKKSQDAVVARPHNPEETAA